MVMAAPQHTKQMAIGPYGYLPRNRKQLNNPAMSQKDFYKLVLIHFLELGSHHSFFLPFFQIQQTSLIIVTYYAVPFQLCMHWFMLQKRVLPTFPQYLLLLMQISDPTLIISQRGHY